MKTENFGKLSESEYFFYREQKPELVGLRPTSYWNPPPTAIGGTLCFITVKLGLRLVELKILVKQVVGLTRIFSSKILRITFINDEALTNNWDS